jgi:hypothetical protein
LEVHGLRKLNYNLLNFFTKNYSPGLIGLVGTKDTIGMAIREAQSSVTVDGMPSLWSHCFIFGDLRLDRRGTGGTKSKNPYIFESDFMINLFKPQMRNGAQENWIGKWGKDTVENAMIIDLRLSDDEKENILATSLQLVDEQVLYPIQELLGTWWSIIMKKQWLTNPLEDPHSMYCSSFVRFCYKEAGRDFLDSTISVSNTTPEDIARAGINEGTIEFYKP